MATKNDDHALKKEKKAAPSSSSSSTTSHSTRRPAAAATSPKPANANVKAVVASTSKPTPSSGSGSARSSVPNYLKPTVSSRTNTDTSSTTTLRYGRKSTLPHDDTATATRRQSIAAAPPNRRRSLDVPPFASSRSFKSLISPDSERPTSANTGATRERTTIRSMSFTPRPNHSSGNKPATGNLERNSKSFKPSVKSSYNPSSPTPTNIKRTTSLTSRNISPKDQMSLSQNLISDIDVTQILDIHGTTQEEDSNLIHIDTVNLESTSKNEEPVFYTPRTGIEQLNDTTTGHGEVNNKEKEEAELSSDDKINIISPKVSEAEREAQTLQVEKPDHHENNELFPEDKEKENKNEKEKEKEKEQEKDKEECKIDEKQENGNAIESQEISGDDGNAADLIVDEKKEEEEGIRGEVHMSFAEGETVRAGGNVCAKEAKAEQEQGEKSGKRGSPAAYNDVIEEAKNKLLAKNTSKVKALAGAFETVIDYESASNSKSPVYHHHT